jgi:hypothetical protein
LRDQPANTTTPPPVEDGMKLSFHDLLNGFIKCVNFLITAIAVTCIILAAYILISDWGSVDAGFFLGWCISIILFAILVTMIVYAGTLGINYQQTKLGRAFGGENRLPFPF